MKRTKSLLRDIIAANAQVYWVAQISANLLRDEELVDLIAASGGKWIFIGMESIDPLNLKDVNKGFNKPGEYAAVLQRLADRNVLPLPHLFSAWTTTPWRGRAHPEGNSHLAAGASDFWLAHTAARDPFVQAARGCRPLDAARALARIHSVSRWPTLR
jgi:hypothetical protein